MKKKIYLFIIISMLCFASYPDCAQEIISVQQTQIINHSLDLTLLNEVNLEKGDIVFRWVNEELFPLFQYFMHPLMFTGNVQDDVYEFVESHGGKDVCLTYLSERQMMNQGIFRYAYRLKEEYQTTFTINNIINFATSPDRLDDEFVSLVYFNETGYLKYHEKNHNPYDETDPLSDKWYCTELIWAAYKNQGLDIDSNDGPVLSIDIQMSPYLEKINIY